MAKKIYKYPVTIGVTVIALPKDSTILYFDVDNKDGKLYFWALIDSEKESTTTLRTLEVVGTGRDISESGKALSYISSCQQSVFVWHLFEIIT